VLPEEEQEDSYRPFLQQKAAKGFGSLGDMMSRKDPKAKKNGPES